MYGYHSKKNTVTYIKTDPHRQVNLCVHNWPAYASKFSRFRVGLLTQAVKLTSICWWDKGFYVIFAPLLFFRPKNIEFLTELGLLSKITAPARLGKVILQNYLELFTNTNVNMTKDVNVQSDVFAMNLQMNFTFTHYLMCQRIIKCSDHVFP